MSVTGTLSVSFSKGGIWFIFERMLFSYLLCSKDIKHFDVKI